MAEKGVEKQIKSEAIVKREKQIKEETVRDVKQEDVNIILNYKFNLELYIEKWIKRFFW